MHSPRPYSLLIGLLLLSSAHAGDPPVPKGGFPIIQQRDQLVTYADGFKTRADIRYPDPAKVTPPSAGWPCILVVHMLTASKNAMRSEAVFYARRGYMTIAYDVRGQGSAVALNPGQGMHLIGEEEKADMADILHQAEAHFGKLMDFNRIAVMGTSQGGYHSFAAAAWSGKTLPHPRGTIKTFPVITAVSPRVAPGNGGVKFSPDGNAFAVLAVQVPFKNWGTKLVVDSKTKAAMQAAFLKQDFATWNALVVTGPGRQDATLLKTARVPIFSSVSIDDYWNIAAINLDTLNTMPVGVPRFFLASTGRHHTPMNGSEERLRLDLELRWFNHFMKGIPDEIVKQDPYLMALTPDVHADYLSATSLWQHRQFAHFPVRPAAAQKTFYLRQGGVLSSQAPNTTETSATLQHQVASGFGPSQYVRVMNSTAAVLSKIPLHQVIYRTSPLAEDMEHVGRGSVQVRIRSNAPNLQLTAVLLDEDPSGKARYIINGYRALRGRKAGAETIRIDLGLAGYVFRKGHRIQLSLENIAVHRPAMNTQTDVVPYFTNATIGILHDTTSLSSFTLPLEPVKLDCQTTTRELSRSTGGSIPLYIDGSAGRAGNAYLCLTSLSGTTPGTPTAFGTAPLNIDALTFFAMSSGSTLFYSGFSGVLDSKGRAKAVNTFAANVLPASLIGMNLSFLGVSSDTKGRLSFSAASRTAILP